MNKKSKPDNRGFVYSTDPNFKFESEEPVASTLQPSEQKLRIWLDTKHRAGKAVTLVQGFVGTDENLQQLGKDLKSACGSGGSAKDGEIIVQGDHRKKILDWLLKKGYKNSKLAGG